MVAIPKRKCNRSSIKKWVCSSVRNAAPTKDTYTLELVNNRTALKQAMDHIQRVNVQMTAKMTGNQQMRNGVYDLIQNVSQKGGGQLTSNLPLENWMLNIGVQRLKGMGRRANDKLKKLKGKWVRTGAMPM